MATKRKAPTETLEDMRASNASDMAKLAEKSGFKNVAMNLNNLAEMRKTVATRRRKNRAI